MKRKNFEIPVAPLVGVHQIGFGDVGDPTKVQAITAQMICRSLNLRNVVAFVGAGVSSAYDQLTWMEFSKKIVRHTLKKLAKDVTSLQRKTLNTFLAGTPVRNRSPLHSSDRTLVILDLCDGLFASKGGEEHDEFRRNVAKLIKPARPDPPESADPLLHVIRKLEIRRFLTTNYDEEIESALSRALGYRIIGEHRPANPKVEDDVGVRPVARSLVRSPQRAEELAQFAVAAPGYEAGVFHLHGLANDRMDGRSMVVTERDYQRVYLQQDRPHRAFREALEVAFDGNAILFIGTGMVEADLLRPLRQFVSEETRGGYERPLFALLPNEYDPASAQEFRQYLYTRYGVKVLYYDVEDAKDPKDYTPHLIRVIEELAHGWDEWWEGWQRKPTIRRPRFYKPGSPDGGTVMVRHYIESVGSKPPFNVTAIERKVTERLNEGARAVVVLGRQGAGKGTLGQNLVTRVLADGTYSRRFFATAHFSNDFLSMIDAAAAFFADGNLKVADLDSDKEGPVSPVQRLKRALVSGNHLLVIGGLERVLATTSLQRQIGVGESRGEVPVPVGEPLTQEVGEFLRMVVQHAETTPSATDQQPRSRIVLTSSLLPEVFNKTHVVSIKFSGVEADDSIRSEDKRIQKYLDELHRALRGNAYALAVVDLALDALGRSDGDAEGWIRRIVGRLVAQDSDARATTAVELALDIFLGFQSSVKTHDLRGLLQRVALFTTPVTAAVVRTCCDPSQWSQEQVRHALDQLEKSGLLLRVHDTPDPLGRHTSETRTTAHTLVRNIVLKQLGSSPTAPGEPHRFEIAGWSSEVPDTLSGLGQAHGLSEKSVESVLRRLESGEIERTGDEYRDLVRAAFGLIRSRWTANAIPRLHTIGPRSHTRVPRTHYNQYQRLLARLLNAIRENATAGLWTSEQASGRNFESDEGILYADELAWLYQELGIVSLSVGLLSDAYALLRAGQHVNAASENRARGYRWYESEIGLGMVQIERGQLSRARYRLETAVRGALALGEDRLAARARGHLGLVHHMMGDYQLSESLYTTAINVLSERGSQRGASIFLKHRGDLRRKLKKFGEAQEDLQNSVAAAESGRHPDLVHYANISRANLQRARGEGVAIEELAPAIDFSRRVGIPKLAWDAQIVQGQIALDHGEYEAAGQLAVATLGIASSLGLRLRLTGSLILLGRITDARGQPDAARRLFNTSMALAERQGNQLLIEKTEEAIQASGMTHSRSPRRRPPQRPEHADGAERRTSGHAQ